MRIVLYTLLIFSSLSLNAGEEKEKPDGTGIGGGGFRTSESNHRRPNSIELSNTSYQSQIKNGNSYAKACKGKTKSSGIYSQEYSYHKNQACLKLSCAENLSKHELNEHHYTFNICFNNDVYKKINSFEEAQELCNSKTQKGYHVAWDKDQQCAKVHCKFNIEEEAGNKIISSLENNSLKSPLVMKYCKSNRSTASKKKLRINKRSPYLEKKKIDLPSVSEPWKSNSSNQ